MFCPIQIIGQAVYGSINSSSVVCRHNLDENQPAHEPYAKTYLTTLIQLITEKSNESSTDFLTKIQFQDFAQKFQVGLIYNIVICVDNI